MRRNADIIDKHDVLFHAQVEFRSKNKFIKIIKSALEKRDSKIE